MVTIPRTTAFSQPSYQNILAQLALERQKNANSQQRIKYLEAENRQLREHQLWQKRLLANPAYKPSEKLTIIAGKSMIDTGSPNEQGLTHMPMHKVAKAIGMDEKTIGRNFITLNEVTTDVARYQQPPKLSPETGQYTTDVYIAFSPELLTRPDKTTRLSPRNQGGKRTPKERCQECGSEQLADITTRVCMTCGCELSKTIRLVNPPDEQLDPRSENEGETSQPTDNLTPQNKKEPTDNLTPGEKPATPPTSPTCSTIAPADIIGLPMRQECEPEASTQEATRLAERERQTAQLLLDIAGDTPEHIVMNANPQKLKKYLTIHRPLTLADMRLHLAGKKTLGATLQHRDGTTRALCFDTDDNPTDSVTWQQLQENANILIAAGYNPILEPSPAERGGHLWLIFSGRVNASAAYRHVCELAPQLKNVGEYWPGRGNQKVRLPAGKYITPTFSKWTHLYDDRTELSKTDLLDYQTPADLIPATQTAAQIVTEQTSRKDNRQPGRLVTSTPDERHQRKYGNHAMWVQWPDEQYLIDRFNSEHTINDLAARDRSGMINATLIGRPERTASVGVTQDGQRFTDFGAGAKREDGTQDGGDPFEFYVRSTNRQKSDVLRELGQKRSKEASREILRAARAGELPADDVLQIITDTGRTIYNENAARHGHPPLDERPGGIVGFSTPDTTQTQEQAPDEERTINIAAKPPTLSNAGDLWQMEQKPQPAQPITQDYDGDYPPPQRPCMCCKVAAWQWTGDRYICSDPGHPPDE